MCYTREFVQFSTILNDTILGIVLMFDSKNGYVFANVYSNKCVTVFLNQMLSEIVLSGELPV